MGKWRAVRRELVIYGVDHYGLARRALYPYLPGLGVQVGQCLVGFRPCWFPGGPVSARSPVVNGLHVHAIRSSIWPAPLA